MTLYVARLSLTTWCLLLAALSTTLPATTESHEVRPAYLQIDEAADHSYEILWKQPVMGEVAVHLVPRLSSGWLDTKPSTMQITANFVLMSWKVAAIENLPLNGQTVSIEGLQNTLTDALVIVHARGNTWQTVLTPARTAQRLNLNDAHPPLALPVFVKLGIEHILSGLDHLLFVMGLVMIVNGRWMLLKTITAFTVAHSITLALATFNVINVPITVIDAEIALSILFLAPEAVRRWQGKTSFTLRHPWGVAFIFGLLHGLGFASGLAAAGLPPHHIPAALLLFNVGVEIGQLGFVVFLLGLAWVIRSLDVRWPRPVRFLPAYALGAAGAFWTIQRVLVVL